MSTLQVEESLSPLQQKVAAIIKEYENNNITRKEASSQCKLLLTCGVLPNTCPFCGSNDLLIEENSRVWVECKKCEATGPLATDNDIAIKMWNCRDIAFCPPYWSKNPPSKPGLYPIRYTDGAETIARLIDKDRWILIQPPELVSDPNFSHFGQRIPIDEQ